MRLAHLCNLPPDRRRLDDATVRVDCNRRDDPAVRKEYMVERAVGIHEDLLSLAANAFELGQLEIRGWQGEQEPIAGQI
jgi:hypothetical protein